MIRVLIHERQKSGELSLSLIGSNWGPQKAKSGEFGTTFSFGELAEKGRPPGPLDGNLKPHSKAGHLQMHLSQELPFVIRFHWRLKCRRKTNNEHGPYTSAYAAIELCSPLDLAILTIYPKQWFFFQIRLHDGLVSCSCIVTAKTLLVENHASSLPYRKAALNSFPKVVSRRLRSQIFTGMNYPRLMAYTSSITCCGLNGKAITSSEMAWEESRNPYGSSRSRNQLIQSFIERTLSSSCSSHAGRGGYDFLTEGNQCE